MKQKGLLSGILGIVLAAGMVSPSYAGMSGVVVGPYLIEPSTEIMDDMTTFSYKVTVLEEAEHAVSHFDFALNSTCIEEATIKEFSPTDEDERIEKVEIGKDPSVSPEAEFVIKWDLADIEFGKTIDEMITFSYILNGTFGPTEVDDGVIIKSGGDEIRASIIVPSCNPDDVPPEEIVAGEVMPLDNTALFLAGLTSSAIWIVPTVASLAAVTGTLLYRSRRA